MIRSVANVAASIPFAWRKAPASLNYTHVAIVQSLPILIILNYSQILRARNQEDAIPLLPAALAVSLILVLLFAYTSYLGTRASKFADYSEAYARYFTKGLLAVALVLLPELIDRDSYFIRTSEYGVGRPFLNKMELESILILPAVVLIGIDCFIRFSQRFKPIAARRVWLVRGIAGFLTVHLIWTINLYVFVYLLLFIKLPPWLNFKI